MSGNNTQQQNTPGGFQTPGTQLTGRRISSQFTPASGFRGPSIFQQRGGTGGSATGPSVQFANIGQGGGGGGAAGISSSAGGRQTSKFVRATDVPDVDMLDADVALKKENYGAPGSSDFRKNMLMATSALPEKFGVARHKIVNSGEEGDQTKHQFVQQTIVNTLHRIKEGHERCKKMDFMDVCMVADYSGDIDNPDCSKWWGEAEINIWKDWEKLTEQQVCAWQYSVNKRFSDEDRIASTWLREFVYNSSTDSLRTAVTKKYDKLPLNQRGGVMWTYYTLCEMFAMSREVKDAMLVFLDLFKRKGVARYTGENLIIIQEEVVGVCKRLDSVHALTDDHVLDVLTGLTIAGNQRFKDTFKFLKQSADLNRLDMLETVSIDSTPIEKIEAIMDKAVTDYDMMCIANTWLPHSRKGGTAAHLNTITEVVNACWNCGEVGHGVGKCPHPKDQAKIAKNKKAFMDGKQSSSGGSRGNISGKGGSSGKGNVDKSSSEYRRKVWEANGMQLINGVLHVRCAKCGMNTTHTTKTHDSYVSNPSTFRLPETHCYVKECARLAAPSAVSPPPPTNAGAGPGDSAAGSAAGMITMDRATLERKLSSFERTSTDPNASAVAEAIRALILN